MPTRGDARERNSSFTTLPSSGKLRYMMRKQAAAAATEGQQPGGMGLSDSARSCELSRVAMPGSPSSAATEVTADMVSARDATLAGVAVLEPRGAQLQGTRMFFLLTVVLAACLAFSDAHMVRHGLTGHERAAPGKKHCQINA